MDVRMRTLRENVPFAWARVATECETNACPTKGEEIK
jgi:hypothetical protein